jgi:hypothetical protein
MEWLSKMMNTSIGTFSETNILCDYRVQFIEVYGCIEIKRLLYYRNHIADKLRNLIQTVNNNDNNSVIHLLKYGLWKQYCKNDIKYPNSVFISDKEFKHCIKNDIIEQIKNQQLIFIYENIIDICYPIIVSADQQIAINHSTHNYNPNEITKKIFSENIPVLFDFYNSYALPIYKTFNVDFDLFMYSCPGYYVSSNKVCIDNIDSISKLVEICDSNSVIPRNDKVFDVVEISKLQHTTFNLNVFKGVIQNIIFVLDSYIGKPRNNAKIIKALDNMLDYYFNDMPYIHIISLVLQRGWIMEDRMPVKSKYYTWALLEAYKHCVSKEFVNKNFYELILNRETQTDRSDDRKVIAKQFGLFIELSDDNNISRIEDILHKTDSSYGICPGDFVNKNNTSYHRDYRSYKDKFEGMIKIFTDHLYIHLSK